MSSRRTLGMRWLILVLAMVVGFVAQGPGVAVAQDPSPSPSGESPFPSPAAVESPAPSPCATPPTAPPVTCSGIQLLEPTPGSIVSDLDDGVNQTYRIVAAVSRPPANATVEAYYRGDDGVRHTIALMNRVVDTSDLWELHWDVPFSLPLGPQTILVRLFSGMTVVASDSVDIELQHRAGEQSGSTCGLPVKPAGCTAAPVIAETASITWPMQNGPLGFYRAPDDKWRAVIDGSGSIGATSALKIQYSTTSAGIEPTFVDCGEVDGTGPADKPRSFRGACTLAEGADPQDVVAIAVLANGSASGDLVRVRPFNIQPSTLSINLKGLDPENVSRVQPSGQRRKAGSGCLTYSVSALDAMGRSVQGVGIDVEVSGPSDLLGFGAGGSNHKVPTGMAEESTSSCSAPGVGALKQGFTIVPNAPDLKRIESLEGTGLSGGGAATGEWRFNLLDPAPGDTQIRAWIDDEDLVDPIAPRPPDDDIAEPSEAQTMGTGQWLDGDLSLVLDRINDSTVIRSCSPYVVTVGAGATRAANINVDVHLQGPHREVSFCAVDYEHEERPPNKGRHETTEHEPVDYHESGDSEAGCPSEGSICRHAEGETDTEGRFTFGVMSAKPGLVKLEAWVEGEPNGTLDRDTRSTGVLTATTTNWVIDERQAQVRLVHPSNATVGADKVVTSNVPIVTRVDPAFAVHGVTVSVAPVTGTKIGAFKKLGDAQRIGLSDLWTYDWDLDGGVAPSPSPTPSPSASSSPPASPPPLGASTNVVDGTYMIRVQVDNSLSVAQTQVTVNRTTSGATDRDLVPEWAALTSLHTGDTAVFSNGQLEVTGDASQAADGVEIWYSTSGPRDGTSTVEWSARCGYVDLDGSTTGTQTFAGTCTLPATTRPERVSALAAVAWDCSYQEDCDGNPTPSPTPLEGPRNLLATGALEAGAGVAITACSRACLIMSPREDKVDVGTCERLVVRLLDRAGEPAAGFVDLHLQGPGDRLQFCPLAAGNTATPTGDGAGPDRMHEHETYGPLIHHAEGLTDSSGNLEFGVRSKQASFESIYATREFDDTMVVAWLDENGDDLPQRDEPNAKSTIHWELPGRCTEVGTDLADSLAGSTEPSGDKICGLDGDDTLAGNEGPDILLGGTGDDDLKGDEGDDEIVGEAGNDQIEGGPNLDELVGGSGGDTLVAMGGDDVLRGGPGFDICSGGSGRDEFASCEEILDPQNKKDDVKKREAAGPRRLLRGAQ